MKNGNLSSKMQSEHAALFTLLVIMQRLCMFYRRHWKTDSVSVIMLSFSPPPQV